MQLTAPKADQEWNHRKDRPDDNRVFVLLHDPSIPLLQLPRDRGDQAAYRRGIMDGCGKDVVPCFCLPVT